MAKLPAPPAALPGRHIDESRTLDEGVLVWMVYRAGGLYPSSWDRLRYHGPIATSRFDHQEPPVHDDPTRGILYAGLDVTAALAEAFQDTRTVDRFRDEPWLVGFDLAVDLVTLDLAGLWPTRVGASQGISSGRRDTARAWSRRIYEDYRDIGGLHYPSSMAGGSFNLAIYERAAGSIPPLPRFHSPLSHPGLAVPLMRICAKIGYSLI